MPIEVLLAVVVGELLAGFYASARKDKDPTVWADGFAVASAGMINVPSRVLLNVTVNCLARGKLEIILAVILRGLLLADGFTDILDDTNIAGDVFFSKKALAGLGLLNPEFESTGSIF